MQAPMYLSACMRQRVPEQTKCPAVVQVLPVPVVPALHPVLLPVLPDLPRVHPAADLACPCCNRATCKP